LPAFLAILKVRFHHSDSVFRHYLSREIGPLAERKVPPFIPPRLHLPASSSNFIRWLFFHHHP